MNDLLSIIRRFKFVTEQLVKADSVQTFFNEDSNDRICPWCEAEWEQKDGKLTQIEHHGDCPFLEAVRTLHEWQRACGF